MVETVENINKNTENKTENENEEFAYEKNNTKRLFLSLFNFQVRKKSAKKDKSYYDFDKIPNHNKKIEADPNYFHMINILRQLFKNYPDFQLKKEDKLLKIQVNEEFSGEDCICGLVQYGSDRDPKVEVDWEDISDTKDINGIVLRNYYFLIRLPNNKNNGCLILQRKGSSGVQTIFMRYLRNRIILETDYKKIRTEINDMVPKEVEKYYNDGIILELDYIYKVISDDSHSEIDLKPKKFLIKVPVENKRKKTPSDILTSFSKKLGFIEEKPTEVKVLTDYEGSKKLFDIDNNGKVKPYVELTDELTNSDYNDNNPEFKAIHREAKKLMNNNFKDLWNGDIVQ